jgi:hypothetical protein
MSTPPYRDFPTKFVNFVGLLAFAVTGLAVSACSDVGQAKCLLGARVCRDQTVWVCAGQGAFTVERVCPDGTSCVSGACLTVPIGDVGRDAFEEVDPGPEVPIDDTGDADPAEDVSGPRDVADSFENRDIFDTTPADTTSPDTTPADTVLVDTSPADTTPADTTPADTTPADTTPEPDVPVVVPEAPPGFLAYERIANIAITDDLMRVVWAPNGAYAIVGGRSGDIGLVRPGDNLVKIGKVGTTLADLAIIEPAKGYFELLVLDRTDGLVRVRPTATLDGLETLETLALPVGSGRALAVEPGTARVGIAAHQTDSIAYLYLWDPVSGLSSPKGFNAGAGVWDLMWASPDLHGGSAALLTTHGVNGKDSKTWFLDTDLVSANAVQNSFGNMGAATWRPDPQNGGYGSYGIVSGWSTNKVYVYDGSWTSGTFPSTIGSAVGPQGSDWKWDGSRALIVGRVIGNPAYASVIEHRPTGPGWSATFFDQSIQGFTSAPWSGNNSTQYLLDVAWRPRTACDEGLIVGSDSGSSFNPTFGYVIRFYDLDDPACD